MKDDDMPEMPPSKADMQKSDERWSEMVRAKQTALTSALGLLELAIEFRKEIIDGEHDGYGTGDVSGTIRAAAEAIAALETR